MTEQRLNQSQLATLYAEQKSNPSLRLGQALCNKFLIPKHIEDVVYEMDNDQFKDWLTEYQFVDYSIAAVGLTLRVQRKLRL